MLTFREPGCQQAGRRRQAAPHQPQAQPRLATLEPGLQRPQPAAEDPRRLFVTLALEVAQYDWRPVTLGHPRDLFIHFGHQLAKALRLMDGLVASLVGDDVRSSRRRRTSARARAATRVATP